MKCALTKYEIISKYKIILMWMTILFKVFIFFLCTVAKETELSLPIVQWNGKTEAQN